MGRIINPIFTRTNWETSTNTAGHPRMRAMKAYPGLRNYVPAPIVKMGSVSPHGCALFLKTLSISEITELVIHYEPVYLKSQLWSPLSDLIFNWSTCSIYRWHIARFSPLRRRWVRFVWLHMQIPTTVGYTANGAAESSKRQHVPYFTLFVSYISVSFVLPGLAKWQQHLMDEQPSLASRHSRHLFGVGLLISPDF